MTSNRTSNPTSIFQDGKLRPGIYKIQNLKSETYLDVIQHSKELCCRPARDLEDGRGLVCLFLTSALCAPNDWKWEIRSFGGGYTVQRVDPRMPEQFCTPMKGIENGTSLYVTIYPVAWRIEVINDELHRGSGYVRFYWGPSRKTWDLWGSGSKDNGTRTAIHDDTGAACQMWRFVPVRTEGMSTPSQSSSESLGLGFLPPYSGDATGQSTTHAQHAESERDDFSTIVTEVTTITTRRRYRVQDT